MLSRFAEHLLTSLSAHGDVELKGSTASDLTFENILKALLKMHFARVDAIAQGAFHKLNLR